MDIQMQWKLKTKIFNKKKEEKIMLTFSIKKLLKLEKKNAVRIFTIQ